MVGAGYDLYIVWTSDAAAAPPDGERGERADPAGLAPRGKGSFRREGGGGRLAGAARSNAAGNAAAERDHELELAHAEQAAGTEVDRARGGEREAERDDLGGE